VRVGVLEQRHVLGRVRRDAWNFPTHRQVHCVAQLDQAAIARRGAPPLQAK
jgi:hypothetical protein